MTSLFSSRKLKLMCFSILFLTWLNITVAKEDLTQQRAILVNLKLGGEGDKLRFYPDKLQFETGKLYRLRISNPSKQKHYFTARKLARSVFTRKVQIETSNNIVVAEVKGLVEEIEVYPGGVAEWWFVPIKTIKMVGFHCSIKGHKLGGMIGKISIN